MMVLGIDPGLSGALVMTNGASARYWKMPLEVNGKDKEIDYFKFVDLLDNLDPVHVFLERALPFAMGSKSAFNYGRGFAALEIALKASRLPMTYVEPNKWTKEMHAGIKDDLKPKAKSLIAVKRLFGKAVKDWPLGRTGKLDEGAVDALLIAGYGLRKFGAKV